MNGPFIRNSVLSLLSLLTLGLAATSQAEDEKIPEIKTASGKTYHDVRVTKVTPSEISIMHESGVSRVPLKDLPDDLKAKFGYDPAKAEANAKAIGEAEKQIADAQRKAAENQALLKTAQANLFMVDYELEDGLVVSDVTQDYWDRMALSIRLDPKNSKLDDLATGGGNVTDISSRGDRRYILTGLPKNMKYARNAVIGGLFVDAGTALTSDGTRLERIRFVGLRKKNPNE
ncbi:MAG: hypothetical protein RLZZ214_2071 [Verrucomicrobiota bacterium]|jgi:hypothetical protein